MQRTLFYFCMKEQKKWVFTVVATASFLAGTRNLMSGFALCSRRHCAVIEIRSLVLARDDESQHYVFVDVYTLFILYADNM